MVRIVLEHLGFRIDDVYVNTRTPNGKLFTAAGKIDAAIAACLKETAGA